VKDRILFKGIFPALITPLNADGTVRTQAVAPIMKWMLSQQVNGFYVLGGTGEGAVLAEKERMRMAEAAADVLQGTEKKLILHVGAADSREAQRLAAHAASIGADAISSVYPNFFCHYTADEAVDYYQSLIEASGLPMLCYCTPMIQGVDVVRFVEKLMKVDGVIGVKYTFPNYFHMQQIKQLNSGNINVINGPDETLLCGLCMGADGGIGTTYNLMPDRFVRLYEAFQNGDLPAAIREQVSINRVISVVLQHGLIPSVKLGLESMGFDVGPAAFPARRYTAEQREVILRDLREAGLSGTEKEN